MSAKEETKGSTDQKDIPKRDVSWHKSDSVIDGETMYTPSDYIRTNNGIIGTGEIGYFTTLNELPESYKGEEIVVPKYYSRFEDEFETHYNRFSTGSNQMGLGLTSRRLEHAVRAISGSGGFRSDDLSVYAHDDLGNVNYYVEYGDDVWVVAPESLNDYPVETVECVEVNGITVPEDTQDVLRGIETFIDFSAEYYQPIESFDSCGTSWSFIQSNGEQTRINANNLQKLGTIPTEPNFLVDEHNIETSYDEEYKIRISEDDIEYQYGDVVDLYKTDNRPFDPRVVGFRLSWEDPRTSRRVNMTGEIKCRIDYYYLLPRNDDGNGGCDRWDVRTTTQRVGEFDPENKEWNPFSV